MSLTQPIFLLPITIPATGVYLRVNGSTDVTLAAGSYYWAQSEAQAGSLNALLADALDLATTGSWSVGIDTTANRRVISIKQNSGSPTATSLVFADLNTLSPYLLGLDDDPAEDTATVTAGTAAGAYQPAWIWEPVEFVRDDTTVPRATTVVARGIGGAAVIDDYGEFAEREIRLEVVQGARVWQWAADDAGFAAAAGLATGEPHAALESFWRRCRTQPALDGAPLRLRYYRSSATWEAAGAVTATLEWSDPDQLTDLRSAVEQVAPEPLLYRARLRTVEP